MATPVVRTSKVLDQLPALIQWYLRPAGYQTTFVIFPWAGFVFAGAAAGVLLAAVDDGRSERRLQTVFGAVGAALIALGFYTAALPAIYRESSFWTSSPTYFAIRLGIVMVAVTMLYGLQAVAATGRLAFSWSKPIETLGRSSLFIYWIHVELVYGYATWPLHGRLPVWGALAACGVFSGLMYLAAAARQRARQWRPAMARTGGPSTDLDLKEAT
jgi:fucose 4-O-acetylase-like acetyltransferase